MLLGIDSFYVMTKMGQQLILRLVVLKGRGKEG